MSKEEDMNDKHLKNLAEGKKTRFRVVDQFFIPTTSEQKNNVHLERMNKDHAFIKFLGGKPMILAWIYNDVYKRKIIEFMSPESVATIYNNQTVQEDDDKKTTVGLGKWWLQHPGRNEYSTVVFDPSQKSGYVPDEQSEERKDGYWNLWEGFTCEPKKGSWKRTKKHIWKILCNKDRVKFRYFMSWIAWAIQNPATRAEVAVVFKGKQGAGKGFIFTQLAQLFGRHGMSISNPEHLTGKHNAHLMQLCFLFADEAYYPGDKDIEGVLKQLITEPYLTVEPKFQNTRLANNCLHIGMSTNAEWVVPATIDARRFFINAVDDRYSKGACEDNVREVYFNALWGEMNNGGREAMLYDLLKLKLGSYHPREGLPKTREMQRQMYMSLSRKEKHVQIFLDRAKFPGILNSSGKYVVTSSELIDFMDEINRNSKVTPRLVGEILLKIGVERTKIRLKDGSEKRGWIFPPLGDIKRRWNSEICPIEWQDYDDWEVDKRTTEY